jgi:phytoene synthase
MAPDTRLDCHRLTRKARSSFYYPLLLLPGRKREALMAVYAFCRRADDLVDDPASAGDEGIESWREELDRCYEGRPGHPITRSLCRIIQRYPIPKEHFEELLRGVEMDTVRNRYDTFEDLYPYCYRVASTVGLISIEIFGYRDPATRQYAVDLGVALQLTNILRDIPTDAGRNRIYLPGEDLDRFGCTEKTILHGMRTEAFRALMHFQCDRARTYYRKAWESFPARDRGALVAAEAMGRIYYSLLRGIERREYDVYSEKVTVPRLHKVGAALDVWGRQALGLPRRWPPGLRRDGAIR